MSSNGPSNPNPESNEIESKTDNNPDASAQSTIVTIGTALTSADQEINEVKEELNTLDPNGEKADNEENKQGEETQKFDYTKVEEQQAASILEKLLKIIEALLKALMKLFGLGDDNEFGNIQGMQLGKGTGISNEDALKDLPDDKKLHLSKESQGETQDTINKTIVEQGNIALAQLNQYGKKLPEARQGEFKKVQKDAQDDLQNLADTKGLFAKARLGLKLAGKYTKIVNKEIKFQREQAYAPAKPKPSSSDSDKNENSSDKKSGISLTDAYGQAMNNCHNQKINTDALTVSAATKDNPNTVTPAKEAFNQAKTVQGKNYMNTMKPHPDARENEGKEVQEKTPSKKMRSN